MTSLQAALAHLAVLLAATAFTGLLVKKRYRICRSFAAYLAAIVVGNRLVVWWPEVFYTLWFWTFKETAYALLKLFVAMEVASKAFQRFVGAAPTLRAAFVACLLLTIAVVLWVPPTQPYADLVGHIQPRAAVGTVWVFTITAALAAWYRVPLHELHRAILVGFVPYLLVFSFALSLVTQRQEGLWVFASYADQVASCVLMGYWCYAAWRREEVPAVAAAVVRELQPWR